MSNPPIDYDSLAAGLTDTLQSVDVSSIQQWGETDSTTEGADLATEHAVHETLDEISTHLEGRGFEVPAPTTEGQEKTDFTEVELSDRDGDHAIDSRIETSHGAGVRVLRLQLTAATPLVNPNVEDPLADGESGAEDDLDDDDRGMWEYPDQVGDAPVHDWRSDPFVGCNICFEQRPVEDVWEAPCQHTHCNVCLKILVRSWYTSTRAPACCGTFLPWEDYKYQINPELAAALDAKKEELDSNDRIYFSERTCSTFIGAQDISGDTATCSACQKQTCTNCKAASHTGDCVPDASISNELEQAEQEGWKRCRQCRMVAGREDGCPHMTCLCGNEFCYDCGGPYRTCDCQEMEQQQDFDYANEYEEEEETIRPPLPPWDRDYTNWGLLVEEVDADTEAQPDTYNTNELPEEEAVDTGGTITEDGEVFGPLSEERWKRIDRIHEINNHHTLGHDRPVNRGTGSGQCEYCLDIMWWYILRCPDCDLRLCRSCASLKR